MASDNATNSFKGSGNFYIGAKAFNELNSFFDGNLDQVRIWHAELTQQQVQERMNRTPDLDVGSTTDLISVYRLDSGSGTTAYDYYGKNNGSFQGDPQWTASGAQVGPQSAVLSDNNTNVSLGPAGSSIDAVHQSGTGLANNASVYRKGRETGSVISGEDYSAPAKERSNVSWGVQMRGSATADLTFSYGDLNGLVKDGSQQLILIKRAHADANWTEVTSNVSHDTNADQFTVTGVSSTGQYAVANTVPAVSLELSSTGALEVSENGMNTLSLTITNTSSSNDATGAMVDVSVLEDLAVQGSSGDGSYSGGTWNVGTVAASGNATLDLELTYDVGSGEDQIPQSVTASIASLNEVDLDDSDDATTSQIVPFPYGSGQSLAFDADGDYTNAGSGIRLDKRSFSIEFWAKRNSAGNNHYVVGQGPNASTNQSLHIGFRNDDKFLFAFYGNDLETPSTYTDSDWHHWAVTFDNSSNTRIIYRDGVQVASDDATNSFEGTENFYLGASAFDGLGNFFDGTLDQVRVWDTTLTQQQIQDRMNRTIDLSSSTADNLIAAYRFDAGNGSIVYDISGNDQKLTLQGDPQWTENSGALVGQMSSLVTDDNSPQTVGSSANSLKTKLTGSDGSKLSVYHWGEASGDLITSENFSSGINGRSNVAWGVKTNTGSVEAELTISYDDNLQNVLPPAVIHREGPGSTWTRTSGWTHNPQERTFTYSGLVATGQYALAKRDIIYIDADAAGNNDGSTWQHAYTDLSTALSNSAAGDEIWIAEGTYHPGPNRDSQLMITGTKDGLEIYGGFSGAENEVTAREVVSHRVILSGDIGTEDDPADNNYNLLRLDGSTGGNITRNTIIDGITFADANADDNAYDNSRAAGIWCEGSGPGNRCSPTLRNIIFKNNHANSSGGAMYNNGDDGGEASPLLENVIFIGNSTNASGGGMANYGQYDSGSSNPVIINALFYNNIADFGGAIYNKSDRDGSTSNSHIVNATFVNNEARESGGAISNIARSGSASPTISNALFWSNVSDANQNGTGSGDQIYNKGEAVNATIEYTLIQGGLLRISKKNGSSTTDGGGNLSDNPILINPTDPKGDDGILGTQDDGLRVAQSSPAIDAGSNSLLDLESDGTQDVTQDVFGSARIQNGTVDLGGYEGGSTSPVQLTISGFLPSSAPAGSQVTINGTGFSGVESVSFDGTNASYSVESGTQITATVPAGAGDGSITVTTSGDQTTSNNDFHQIDAPYGSGHYLALDGVKTSSADYIEIMDPYGLYFAREYTAEAWIKWDGSPGFRVFLSKPNQASSSGFNFVVQDSILRAGVGTSSGGRSVENDDEKISADQWIHVATTYDGTIQKLYINGRLAEEVDHGSEAFTTGSDQPLFIGREFPPGNLDERTFPGEIDQVRIWDTAITQQQIKNYMDQTIDLTSGIPDGLASAYRFDTGTGTTAYDLIDGNNGTLQNDPAWKSTGGARVGQKSTSVSDGEGTIGSSGGSLNLTNVTTSGTDRLSVIQYGNIGNSAIDSETFPEDVSKRSNLLWDIQEFGEATADLSFSYGDVSDINFANPRLLKRSDSEAAWQDVTGQFSHDREAKTFSATGITDYSQYAIGEGLGIPGLARRSLIFDGSGDYITTSAGGDDLGLAGESFTIETWFKAAAQNNETLVGMDGSTDNSTLKLLLPGSGKVTFGFLNNDLTAPENTIQAGTWHHAAFVYDKSTGRRTIYIDGKEVASDQPGSDFQGTNELLIGRWGGSNYFDGSIDEVRVWQDVRTPVEIRTNLFQQLKGDEAGLVAYWAMDSGNGSTATDRAADNDGTFQGDPQWSAETYPYGTVISGSEGWRMMAAPTGDKTYNELLDELWTQGIPGSDSPDVGTPNVLKWDEAAQLFVPVDGTNTPEAGQGFIAYVYGDQDYDGTDEGFPKMLRAGGTQRTTRINPSLSYTDDGDAETSDDGWNLIANPYGSTINWDVSDGWTKANIDQTIYVWSDTANTYLSWNGDAGTLPNGKIAPWQGFWVKANAGNPSLKINEQARDAGAGLYKEGKDGTETISSVKLFVEGPEERRAAAVLHFDDRASLENDRLDAWQLDPLSSDYLSLYTTSQEGKTFDINALPTNTEALDGKVMEVPLHIEGFDLGGEYRLSWEARELPDGWGITLKDTHTDQVVGLQGEGEYHFELDGSISLASSRGNAEHQRAQPLEMPLQRTFGKANQQDENRMKNQRFVLLINPKGAAQQMVGIPTDMELNDNYPNPFNPTTVIRYGVPEQAEVRLAIYNVLGQQVRTLVNEQKSAGRYEASFDGSRLASGMYIYRLTIGSNTLTKKMMLIK